jgi:sarcosine oxidase
MNEYEVIIIGLGAVGSSVLYQLAQREEWILGLERMRVPNNPRSSYGATQLIPLTNQEDPVSQLLVGRSNELWQELNTACGDQLVYNTGSIHAGPTGSAAVEESKKAYDMNHLPYQMLTGSEVNQYFPGSQLPEDMEAVFRGEGGFLLSERCIINQVALGLALGANIRPRERVLDWEPTSQGVKVITDKDTYSARKLVVCSREWTDKLLPQMARRPRVERQVMGWFKAQSPWLIRQDVFPTFDVSAEEGRFRSVPDYGKAGFNIGYTPREKQLIDPDYVDREVHQEDEALLMDFATRYIPGSVGSTLSFKTSMPNAGPEQPPILDTLPGFPQVIVAAGFSGVNFLFSSVAGEIVADLAQNDETEQDTSMFRLDRLQ